MFRFIVKNKVDNHFELSKETLKHIKVARVENENFICIYEEKFYECKLDADKALILNELDEDHEFKGNLILAASVINTKRFELLIQKATELGVKRFIPVLTENVSQKLHGDLTKKIERWNKIAYNATEQSFRNKIMTVETPMSLAEVLKIDSANKYIAHEKNDSKPNVSFESESIFLVGPEGGFTENEVNLAKGAGYKVVSLGKRILRAETASINMISRVND